MESPLPSPPRESPKKISLSRRPKKIASGFAGGLRLFRWGSSSPKSGHRVQAAGTGSRRALIPTGGRLTPLAELVGSRPTKGARTLLTEGIPRRSVMRKQMTAVGIFLEER